MDHGFVTGAAVEQAFEQGAVFIIDVIPLAATVRLEQLLDSVECRLINDGFVLSIVYQLLMFDFPGADRIGEERIVDKLGVHPAESGKLAASRMSGST